MKIEYSYQVCSPTVQLYNYSSENKSMLILKRIRPQKVPLSQMLRIHLYLFTWMQDNKEYVIVFNLKRENNNKSQRLKIDLCKMLKYYSILAKT